MLPQITAIRIKSDLVQGSNGLEDRVWGRDDRAGLGEGEIFILWQGGPLFLGGGLAPLLCGGHELEGQAWSQGA